MENYLEIANKPIFWLVCMPAVLIIAGLSLLFYKQAVKTAPLVDLNEKDCFKALKIGSIAAIGPSLAVFAVLLTLMGVLGGPFAWMRLSIIGSATTEMIGAQVGAAVVGATIGDASYDINAFASSVWTITLNTCGFIIFVFLFAHRGEKVKSGIAKRDVYVLAIIGTAAILGINGYLATYLSWSGGIGHFTALMVALLCGLVINAVGKKYPKILEFNMGISMFAGMFAGQLVINMTA